MSVITEHNGRKVACSVTKTLKSYDVNVKQFQVIEAVSIALGFKDSNAMAAAKKVHPLNNMPSVPSHKKHKKPAYQERLDKVKKLLKYKHYGYTGLDTYNKNAFKELRELADMGSVEALYMYGRQLWAKDSPECIPVLIKASEKGYHPASSELEYIFNSERVNYVVEGRFEKVVGDPNDPKWDVLSKKYRQIAADQGCPYLAWRLAWDYHNKNDRVNALKYARLAEENGCLEARVYIAYEIANSNPLESMDLLLKTTEYDFEDDTIEFSPETSFYWPGRDHYLSENKGEFDELYGNHGPEVMSQIYAKIANAGIKAQ